MRATDRNRSSGTGRISTTNLNDSCNAIHSPRRRAPQSPPALAHTHFNYNDPGATMSDTHATNPAYEAEHRPDRSSSGPFKKEAWWAVWIGLAIIVIAYLLFASGTSIKWLAVAPAKWSSGAQAAADVRHHLPNHIALFIVFAILFGLAVAALGQRIAQFVPGFLVVFVVSTLIFVAGASTSS